ncbi:hypothetical protein G3O08_18805 [Cryomorpha ignava]|uniref:Uncharacterized protein n=1 Tax=Cryomorpha ignava TaxID=101383 RepID=A0A7K3WV64_9FLAO|nr:hypothetical protein [Cryomorpha ignava]NEN25547.1 hypothetical protein [Cryomorpha ignava]
MILKNTTITRGFILAGLMNASVLIFSRFFTNSTIPEFDPEVMSNFGLLMILIWGLAYISVARNYDKVKWLVGIFVIEKVIYGYIWINWMLNNSVSDVFEKDVMAGLYYSIYGINDWVFSIFFLWVFVQLAKGKKTV